MKGSEKKTRLIVNTAFVIIAAAAMIVTVYIGSSPRQYDLQIGDISSYDIAAPLDFADNAETVRRALEAMAQIPNVMIRSEVLSNASSDSMRQLMELVQKKRDMIYKELNIIIDSPNVPSDPLQTMPPEENRTRRPDNHEIEIAVSSLISAVDQELGIVLPSGEADTLIRMEEERFLNLKAIVNAETNAIIVKTLDDAGLQSVIEETVLRLEASMEYYRDDAYLVGRLLTLVIHPNVEYNEEATDKARQAAYDRVMGDPVMINRGARIISQGDVITPESKMMLDELNLTVGTRFDWQRLGSIILLVLLLCFISILFFMRYESELMYSTPRTMIALLIAIMLPLIMTAYLARDLPLSSPVYFAAVVITAYFGLRTSIFVTSLLIIMIAPMTSFNPSFSIVALTGCLVASLFTRGTSGRQDNYARIILATSLTTAMTAFIVSFLQKESWALISSHVIQSTVSGALSVIIGIGIMPLFELIFNTVSPLRLIELSQPGHPLMKRLFVEAPGTSQHAMMVANLADTAAEAIGADAMIARVGAYFHDVGKLEAPLMFTENQSGENPHDLLSPIESARIITKHPEDSMAIGRRYRLPLPLLRIAHEHHGSTVLQYFWNKARHEAEERGEEPPSIDLFRYRTPLPSTRESAIVMLADSTEAAMRSEGIKTLEQAELLIKNIIKDKIDQEQLVKSGLSFADVETILQSFLRVYAGHFHERVPYRSQKPKKQQRSLPTSSPQEGDYSLDKVTT